MPARSTTINFQNNSLLPLVLGPKTLAHGIWSAGTAADGTVLPPGASLVVQSESSGVLTGIEGSVILSTPVGLLQFEWDNPYIGENSYCLRHVPLFGLDAYYDGGGGNNAQVSVAVLPSQLIASPFRASTHGWHFSNNTWMDAPNGTIPVLNIPIGSAANGMCGGMVYSAHDYYLAGRPIPPMTANPRAGDPYFVFIASRLWDSFHLPDGIQTYFAYMDPSRTAGQRADYMIRNAIPQIRRDIAAGRPAALGLVRTLSQNVMDLGHNHQVSAVSYLRSGDVVTLGIYDPNYPDADDRFIAMDLANPAGLGVNHNLGSPVHMYLYTGYAPKVPPA